MKSSGSPLASRFLRRRGQGSSKRGGEESDDGRALSPPSQHPSTSTSTSSAPLVQVEPLHALSSAAIHTNSFRAAARALRGEGGGGAGAGGAVPPVPGRENTAAEELLAVVTMASVFGFVFFGPWLTLAALVDVVVTTAKISSGSSSSSSSSFYFSLAFLALVAVLTFAPVYPRGAWPLFRDARVWDCWRRYFRLRIVSPPLPFLEVGEEEGEEGEEEEREKLSSGANGGEASSSPLSSSSSLVSPPSLKKRNKKAYIFAHYPHGCFPVGSFLTAVGLVGCHGTGLPAGTRPAVASALFRLPVLRQFYTWCNCVPCDSGTLSSLLRSGTSIGVIPEGIAGIFHGSAAAKVSVSSLKDLLPPLPPPSPRLFGVSAPAASSAVGNKSEEGNPAAATVREERIFTQHKGYIKLALRTGAGIVPVYALGQSRVLSFWGFPALSRKLRLSLGIWWGRFGLPCLPRKEEIVMVACSPIEVGEAKKKRRSSGGSEGEEEPTQEEIDAVFAQVARSLKRAHDELKEGIEGWESSEMVFC